MAIALCLELEHLVAEGAADAETLLEGFLGLEAVLAGGLLLFPDLPHLEGEVSHWGKSQLLLSIHEKWGGPCGAHEHGASLHGEERAGVLLHEHGAGGAHSTHDGVLAHCLGVCKLCASGCLEGAHSHSLEAPSKLEDRVRH